MPANSTPTWFTHSWPSHWFVVWTAIPTSPVVDGPAQLRLTVRTTRQAERLIKYHLSIQNLTAGTLPVECDEAVFPAMNVLAADFRQQYPDARIDIRCVEARAATANFVNDSVKVIICARPLNDEERNVLTATKTWFEEYHVAQSAIAVIVNPANPVKALRMGERGTMINGESTARPMPRGWPPLHR